MRRLIARRFPNRLTGWVLFRLVPFLGIVGYCAAQTAATAAFAACLVSVLGVGHLQEVFPDMTGTLRSGGTPAVAALLALNVGLFSVMQFISKGWADAETATATAANLDQNSALAPHYQALRRVMDERKARSELTPDELKSANAVLRQYSLNAESFWAGQFSLKGFRPPTRHYMLADLDYLHFLTHENIGNRYMVRPEFRGLQKLACLWGARRPQMLPAAELPDKNTAQPQQHALPAPPIPLSLSSMSVLGLPATAVLPAGNNPDGTP